MSEAPRIKADAEVRKMTACGSFQPQPKLRINNVPRNGHVDDRITSVEVEDSGVGYARLKGIERRPGEVPSRIIELAFCAYVG